MAKVQFDLIEQGWQSLKARAIQPDADPLQLVECRAFFFAGARHLMTIIHDQATLSEGDDVTADDMAQMLAIEAELEAFFILMLKGRA